MNLRARLRSILPPSLTMVAAYEPRMIRMPPNGFNAYRRVRSFAFRPRMDARFSGKDELNPLRAAQREET